MDIRKLLMGFLMGTLVMSAANATKLDVIDLGSGTTVISLDLDEGETSGADSYINNLFAHDGTTGTRIKSFSPVTGDGDYSVQYCTGDGFFTDFHDAIYRVSGWVDHAPRGTDTKYAMTGGETKFLAVGKFYQDGVTYVSVFNNYLESCVPGISILAVEFVGHPEINVDKVSITSNILKIDLAGVVVNEGDTIVLNIDLKAANGYGNDSARLTVNITPYAITLKTALTPDGTTPDAGGVAEISAIIEGGTPAVMPVSADYEVRIGIPTKTTAIDLVATDDGVVYEFKDWTTGSFTSTSTGISTNFNELSGGSGAVSNVTLTGTFTILNSKLFTATKEGNGNGVVSPDRKAVADGGSVFFRATAICSTLKSAKYTPDGGAPVELDVSGFAGDYYSTKTWTIPVNGNTAATAEFEIHAISSTSFDDIVNTLDGGGGSPGSLPTPGSLSDAQLADLTKLLQDKNELEPGVWDDALDQYLDEIKDRLAEINDLLDTPELDDDTKTALTDVKTVYQTLTGTATPTTTASTPAATSTDGGTTIVTTDGGIAINEDPEPSNPAYGAAAAGLLMLMDLTPHVYKPHWTTERPDTPYDSIKGR